MSQRLADFYIIGAPKCGTTSLQRQLDAHPEVFMTSPKEPHRFGSDLDLEAQRRVQDPAAYAKLFENGRDAKVVGEASVFYMYSERAAQEIAEATPKARFIALLRDPVEMVRSMHWQAQTTRNENVESLREALDLQESRAQGERIPATSFFPSALQYERLTDFAPQLSRFFDRFGRERVLVLTIDELQNDPAAVYSRACAHIGVDKSYRPSFEHQNAARPMRNVWIRNLIAKNKLIRKTLGLMPASVRARLGDATQHLGGAVKTAPKLDRELRAELCARLRPGVDQLEQLLDRRLPNWARMPEDA